MNCLPRDQSLSDLVYSPRRKPFPCARGQPSLVLNSALLPSDVRDFAMLPAQRFWREIVSCDPEVTNSVRAVGKKIPAIQKNPELYNFLSLTTVKSSI